MGNKVNGNASVKVNFCSHFPFFRRAGLFAVPCFKVDFDVNLPHAFTYLLPHDSTIYVAVNFFFPFVSNSLADITIPKNNGKIKIN